MSGAKPYLFPMPGSPCCICDQPITEYDSYGVGLGLNARFHWHCIRAEADMVTGKGFFAHLRSWWRGKGAL